MANLINAPRFNAKNQPIEIATDTSGDMRLLLSNVSSPNNNIYEGIVSPSPTNSRVGINIQPYVYDEVDLDDFVMGSTSTNNVLSNAAVPIYTRMLDSANAIRFSQITIGSNVPYVVYKKLSYNDNLKMINSQINSINYKGFGKYEEWIEKTSGSFGWLYIGASGALYDDSVLYNFNNRYGTPNCKPVKIMKNSPFYFPMQWLYNANAPAQYKVKMLQYNANDTLIYTSTPYQATPTRGYTNFIYSAIQSNTARFELHITLPNYINDRIIHFDVIDPSCFKNEPYQLYWINNRGGLDWVILSGKSVVTKRSNSKSYETTFRTFDNTSFSGDLSKQINKKYNVESYKEYNLNSEWIKEEDFKWLDDIIDSEYVWLYNPKDESIKAVDVLDTDFMYKNFRNDKMFNFEINLRDQHKE